MSRLPLLDASVAGTVRLVRMIAVPLLVAVIAGCQAPVVDPPPRPVQEAPRPVPEVVDVIPTPPGVAILDALEEEAPPEEIAELGEIPVALLVPLSGPRAALGQAMLDAAQMALFDARDSNIVLLPKDTGGEPGMAARAAEEALADGARLILGPIFAPAVAAVAPIARNRGVSVIAFSNDHSVAGGGVYLLGFTPAEQVQRVVSYASGQGLQRFAGLAQRNAYGEIVRDALLRSAEQTLSEVTQVVIVPPDAGDLSPDIQRLAAARGDFDAVLVALAGMQLRAAAPLFPYYDLDPGRVRLLGTSLWEDPAILGEPALIGGWFAAPPPDGRRSFETRFESSFGSAPPRLATHAYDAAALAAALAAMPRGPDFGAEALEAPRGFAGVDGIFRFNRDGLAQRALAVLEVTASGFRVIDPPLTRFPPPLVQ